MLKYEKSFWNYEDRWLPYIFMAILTVIGLWARRPMMYFLSDDARDCLLPWYEMMKETGLGSSVGEYNFLYQFWIFIMTKLPFNPLHLYKLLSIGFDYLLAGAAAVMGAQIAAKDKLWTAAICYGCVILSPLVVLNSAAWAQCDSIFCFFAVAAVIALMNEKWKISFILLGFSFAFKLQAVFFLPIFLFVYYQKRKFSILQFLWIPGVLLLTGVPTIFFGRSPFEVFSIYFSQTGFYTSLSLNYPSPWLFVMIDHRNPDLYATMKNLAMGTAVVILALVMLNWLKRRVSITKQNMVYMTFMLCYTCVLFLPAMHERYGYPYEILAIMIAVILPKTIPLCAGLIGITMCTYGNFLFKTESMNLIILAIFNLVIYGVYLVLLNREILSVHGADQDDRALEDGK